MHNNKQLQAVQSLVVTAFKHVLYLGPSGCLHVFMYPVCICNHSAAPAEGPLCAIGPLLTSSHLKGVLRDFNYIACHSAPQPRHHG